MANEIIRKALKENCLHQWELAEKMGISEQTIYRRLRTELPPDEQKKILAIIEDGRKEN